jgi:hypothetical protein
MHETESVAGWILSDNHTWWFLGVWIVVVLVYGLWRSLGEAKQDPIRPSGPMGRQAD